MGDFLEKTFKLQAHGTNVKTEVIAGVTTFMTMAYILAVNPSILSTTGMDAGAIFVATALGAAIGTFLMAFCANYPFALAPGMGLNAFFAFTVVGIMKYSWQTALAAVFIEGIIFLIMSLTKIREAIFNSIPYGLKLGVSGGIGLFIAFIGMQSAKIVVDGPCLVGLYNFKAAIVDGSIHTTGVGVILALIGVLVTVILMQKKVPGDILIGILLTWGLGMLCEVTGIYVPNPKLGMFSVMPNFSNGLSIPSIAPTFMQMDFSNVMTFGFVTVMLSFMFVDLFDTLGTLMCVASKAELLDERGYLPNIKGALLADSIGTAVGAVLGTSTVSTYVESSAGVSVGGRTGLTSIVTGLLFIASLVLSPIFLAIPAFATAPALIVVGFLMVNAILKVPFDDFTEAFPAYVAMIAMPFTYSISEGIAMGIISYTVINVVTGQYKTKNVSGLIYILAVIFVLKYIFV